GPIRTVAQGRSSLGDMQFTADGKTMVYTDQSGSYPTEIKSAQSSGGPGIGLTHLNDNVLSQYQLTPLESISVASGESAKVESFVVKPPDFDPAKKYRVLFAL